MKVERIYVAIHPDGSFLTFGNKAGWVTATAAKLAMVNSLVAWSTKTPKGQTQFDAHLKPLGYRVEAITAIKSI